jgi:hypothetical protein
LKRLAIKKKKNTHTRTQILFATTYSSFVNVVVVVGINIMKGSGLPKKKQNKQKQ